MTIKTLPSIEKDLERITSVLLQLLQCKHTKKIIIST